MSMNGSSDRRVRRTQRSLQGALSQLMEEKPYQKIRVNEIAQRAEVSRPTFYLHYETKDDLLLSLFDALFAEFQEVSNRGFEQGHFGVERFTVLLFQHMEKNAGRLRVLMEAGVEPLVQKRMAKIITDVMKKHRAAASLPMKNGQLVPYMIDFLTAGMLALLKRWLRDNSPIAFETLGLLMGNVGEALEISAERLPEIKT